MTLPDRNNPYDFSEFLAWRNSINYYDDTFIKKVIKHYSGSDWTMVDREATSMADKVSFRWKQLSEASAVPEKRAYMQHYDGYHNRIDRIVRPKETEILEREVFGERLFDKTKSPWVKLVKMFLIYQNGEAGVACPITCTEGLVMLLDKYADSPETLRILEHCREGIDGDIAIGAQYLSEIQGGSDVQANRLEAVEEDGTWRLYGSKFFCSATHADYVVVTAKPSNSKDVALFVMPSWMPGNKEKEIRNSYTIDRIKWKLGTSELPTGEITFNGAIAYPIGPLNKGIANVVGIVLTYSRLTVGISAAAFMTRASREATHYAQFRTAFGQTIDRFPLVKGQLNEIQQFARRTTAGAFKLYREFLDAEESAAHQLHGASDTSLKKKQFRVRELIMLQKIVASMDSTDVLRKAMSIFGGHGVMEDFSSLPRLYRDSAINELWEGPRNILLTQVHRDMQGVKDWYSPKEFVADLLKGADPNLVQQLASEFSVVVNHPSLIQADDETLYICETFDKICTRLFHVYQEVALTDIENSVKRYS